MLSAPIPPLLQLANGTAAAKTRVNVLLECKVGSAARCQAERHESSSILISCPEVWCWWGCHSMLCMPAAKLPPTSLHRRQVVDHVAALAGGIEGNTVNHTAGTIAPI